MDRCIRVWAKKDNVTAVVNSCASIAVCDAAKKACDNFTGQCAVSCCETDECNAGSTVLPSERKIHLMKMNCSTIQQETICVFIRPPANFRQSFAYFSAILCEPCCQKSRFFLLRRNFPFYRWGLLGCLLECGAMTKLIVVVNKRLASHHCFLWETG